MTMEIVRHSMRLNFKITIIATVMVAVTYLVIWSRISQLTFALPPLNIIITLQRASQLRRSWTGARSSSNPAEFSPKHPARELIDEIKNATRLVSGPSAAADGSGDITAMERDAWNLEHPCLSRSELVPMYNDRKYARKLPPANPAWDELLIEYAKLHRACTKKVGNLTDYFLSRNRSTGCRFAVADATIGAGLGNKLLTMASALLYAVLTKRVLLIPSSALVPHVMCEPFLGSSWALDSDASLVPRFSKRSEFVNSSWTSTLDFFENLDEEVKRVGFSSRQPPNEPPLEHAVGAINADYQLSNRFYCSTEQAFYSQVTWLYFAGCMYSIPKLFASPLFRPKLESLFPDKLALTRILRSVFLPGDDVWGRVVRINRERLAGADRRVGIQVRYNEGVDHYMKLNHLVNERIVDCVQRHAILPRVGYSNSKLPELNEGASSKPLVKVFVASLFPGLMEHLSRVGYNENSSEITGEDVSLVQISNNGEQHYSVEEDMQSFAEILLLSLSDQLLVTPCSTFGSLAQAYGALTPWFIERREDTVGRKFLSCDRGQTVDPCEMMSAKLYTCPHDPGLNEKPIYEFVPYVKACMPIDEPFGFQLITSFQS